MKHRSIKFSSNLSNAISKAVAVKIGRFISEGTSEITQQTPGAESTLPPSQQKRKQSPAEPGASRSVPPTKRPQMDLDYTLRRTTGRATPRAALRMHHLSTQD